MNPAALVRSFYLSVVATNLPPPEVFYRKIRNRILRCEDYMGTEDFLQNCCWQRYSKYTGALYGEPPTCQRKCVVVGLISSEHAKLGPMGNFDTTDNLSNAQRELLVGPPLGFPGYEDDFPHVLENIRQLLRVMPGNGPAGSLLAMNDGSPCLKFECRIFQEKVCFHCGLILPQPLILAIPSL